MLTWQPKINLFPQILSLKSTRLLEFGCTRMCRQFSSDFKNSGWLCAQLRVKERGRNEEPVHQPHIPLHPCTPPVQ